MEDTRTLRLVVLQALLAWMTVLPAPGGETAVGQAGSSSPLARPQFRTSAELVQIDVGVVDGDGRPVRGLGAGDFVLEEDGVAQKLEAFESVTASDRVGSEPWLGDRVSTNTGLTSPASRMFVVLFDDVHLSEKGAAQARAAVAEFLGSLRKGDAVGVASTAGGMASSGRMLQDSAGLRAALQRLKGLRPQELRGADQITDYEAMRIVQYNDTQVLQTVVNRWTRGSKIWEQTWGPDSAPGGAPGSPGAASGGGIRASLGSTSSETQTVQALATERYEAAKQRRRQTLQAITRSLAALAGAEGRKALIVVSEDFLTDPADPQYTLVSAASRRANAPLYVVDVGGPAESVQHAEERRIEDTGPSLEERHSVREGLAAIAMACGGFAITNTSDLTGGLRRVARESTDYYVLGYQPTNRVMNGEFRRIRVVVRRPGVEVRARAGYVASPAERGPDAERGRDPALGLREAAAAPFSLPGIPLRMSAYTFEATRAGTTRTLLVCELKLDGLTFEQKDGQFTAELDVLLTATQYATGRTLGDRPVAIQLTARSDVRGQNAWHRIVQEVDLPAGLWQARLVVRDRKGSGIGSVVQSLDVPGDGRWRASTPVLSDAAAPDPERGSLHALPLARRTFAAAGVLYCEFEVYGSGPDSTTGLPRVSAGFSLVREGGAVARQETPVPIDPAADRRLSQLITVPIRGLKPGNYDLVLQIHDLVTGQTQEQHEPLTLALPARPTLAFYKDLVQDYVEGHVEDAVATLLTWRGDALAELAKKAGSLPGSLPRAAVMLHTEAAMALRAGGQAGQAPMHLEFARGIAEKAEHDSTFRRDWLLAVGFELQAHGELSQALPFFVECQGAFPSAAEAWLAAGTVYEFSAFPDGLGGSRVARPPGDLVHEAETEYRQALAVDPSLLEARLRLGRVLQRSGRPEEALGELKTVASASDGGATAALAHLFLGELLEHLGKTDEAAQQYRAALDLDATLQPAGLALGGVLARRGDRAGAVEILERVLRNGCPVGPPRLFAYRLGLGLRARAAIDALRKEVHS